MTHDPQQPFDEVPFDEIVYRREGREERQSFAAFMALPLEERLELLIIGRPTFFKDGEPVPAEQAIRLSSKG